MTTKIFKKESGPIALQGKLLVALQNGKEVELENVSLCGCGLSKQQPICDGSHKLKLNNK